MLMVAGCAGGSSAGRTRPAVKPDELRPDVRLHGRVVSTNEQGQFVVVDFNVGEIPPLQTRMNVYRDGRTVGELKLTGPARDNLVAADITRGEAAVGDEAIWDREADTERRP